MEQDDLRRIYRTRNEGDYPPSFLVELEKEEDLRYGENPNQPGALYSHPSSPLSFRLVKSGKAGMSATNVMDVTRALEILKLFDEKAVAVMKHAVPSGFAVGRESLAATYAAARDADARSAFGSVVVLNRPVDGETARELAAGFVEAVAAPGFAEEAVALLGGKRNLRLVAYEGLERLPRFAGDETGGIVDIRSVPGGKAIVQEPYLTRIRSTADLLLRPSVTGKEGKERKVARAPDERETRDLLTAWHVSLGVRSNAVVIVKEGVTLAIGSGQQERVGAVEQAILKAYQKALDRAGIGYDPLRVMERVAELAENPLAGAVVASDGFFPFKDSIELLAADGIAAVVQPGGSVKDEEVIEAVNEHGMAMAFTGERCFGHF